MNVFQSYFHHLAESPERIDSLLMWFVCTVFLWFWMLRYRERSIKGQEGENGLWEGGEQTTYWANFAFWPVVFYVLFFTEYKLHALFSVLGIIAYQISGRYIFDWALAFKSGLSAVPKEPEKEVVTTTTQNSQGGTKVETVVK